MKVSLEWLNDYVDLSGLSVEEISHALTMVGFEVEGVEQSGLAQLDHVVVGEILSFEQHPDADRLSVCQVDVGDGTTRTIVCGAKNFRANDRVIVALPGAVLPGDFKIKKSKLRGVASEGMMCSERELGLGEDHAGIAILHARPELGTPVNQLYPEPDTVFDMEITPNRPDALSHLGIARELAAWFKRPLAYPALGVNFNEAQEGRLVDSIECLDDQLCPHYRGYSVRGVGISESPAWLKRRLTAIGLRPINAVVDATNYVLHETGQPLHAFDAAKIGGHRIIVRPAYEGETIVTLDEKKRSLKAQNLVIADADRALVVAGVMGSVDAEVDQDTRDIFLESAYFNPVSIRRTSRQLGLSTDSSYRFERGIDPQGAEYAALRCLDLILQLAGGELLGPPLVCGEAPLVERQIDLSPQWVRERMGFSIDDAEMKATLERLELSVAEGDDDEGQPFFRVTIPSYRQDLYRPIDLVEEVVRMYGSDRIPEGTVKATVTLAEDAPAPVFQRAATHVLIGAGYQEALHYTLRSEDELRRWYGHAQADALAVANPLAADASHLRTSLVPGLLDCLKLNLARNNPVQRLFECGRVFREYNGRAYEMVSVGFVALQEGAQAWRSPQRVDYFHAARLVEDLLVQAGVGFDRGSVLPIVDENPWQAGHSGVLGSFQSGFQAKFGLLNVAMTREWDIESPVVAGTIYLLPAFLEQARQRANYKPFSVFPPAIRDLAVIIPESMPAARLESALTAAASAAVVEDIVLESVRIFDIYAGKGLPEGHRSVACKLTFRHPARTLTDKEVNAIFQSIQESIEQQEGMQVRR